MRRLDVIAIGIGLFAGGGILYLVLQWTGLDGITAGIWSQAILVGGVIGWVFTYLFRVMTKNMTYSQQVRDYQEAVLQKRLEELTPEELSRLQAEIEQENQK
ncbi:MAG: hypothetical protein N5P05_003570 [Chroococcopsis gigantea SAG 12.99]|jgi:hypothetical protein|nr:hypothetical protein [Chroococcopsis gigantea SAG 12.99]